MGKLLEAKNISKQFPGVKALDSVSIDIERGEVFGLIGENGAGKSTLIKILAGVHPKDSGEIYLEGNKLVINNPEESQEAGISIIYQELNLVPNLSIAENIFLGKEFRRGRMFLNKNKTLNKAEELLKRVGLNVTATTYVSELSISQRQMVEVAKALAMNAKLIIMDEPTSTLTEKETEVLFSIIHELKKQHIGILFVSHKMDEIFLNCDRVHILRDGKDVDTLKISEAERDEIIDMMVGREIGTIFVKDSKPRDKVLLSVSNLRSGHGVEDVSFDVKYGEIVGFAGLVGSGRTETMRTLFGLDKVLGGTITIEGKQVSISSPVDAIKLGFGFVPEDRKEQGLILGMTVKENITLPNIEEYSKYGLVSKRAENNVASHFIESLDIKTPHMNQITAFLSGGNQQKVVLSKWLEIKPRLLILDEPTRGIDVGAKKEIHKIMNDLVTSGVSIIMISSELPEVLSMSDRIVVMHGGVVKGEIPCEGATQEIIMRIALT